MDYGYEKGQIFKSKKKMDLYYIITDVEYMREAINGCERS
jgi:hypothetical protein